jgi:hypothetical protein
MLSSCPASALNLEKYLDLRSFQGSFFQAMTATQNGIKACIDADGATPFNVGDWAVVQAAAVNFDPEVYQHVVGLSTGGESGLQQLVNTLASSGQTYTPLTLTSAIATAMQTLNLVQVSNIGLNAVESTPFLALASGAGTLVRIDDSNYCYHVCYKPGSPDPKELAEAVKSGRSFGASPAHNSLDASDLFYLTELGSYLDPNQTADPSDFYRTIFQTLTQCDSSGWKTLSNLGQGLATDFIAIYTAELDRNLMANLTTHSWEDDLAEVTLVSAYGVQAGMVFINGQLTPGSPTQYYAKGPTGSGIGETRNDRHSLQCAVCQIEQSLHPDDYKTLASLIGGAPPNGDLIHQVMVFLNDPTQQATVGATASQLTDAIVQFLLDIRTEADQITAQIINPTQTLV